MSESTSKILAIVVAAGVGSRCGTFLPKQYLLLDEHTVLEHAVLALRQGSGVETVYVAVRSDDTTIDTFNLPGVCVLKTGGATREETVYKTLLTLADRVTENTLVLVHDAARPLLRPEDVRRLIEKTTESADPLKGAVLTLPVSDTVKRVDGSGQLDADIDRTGLVRIATPQAFRYATLLKALATHMDATDESSAVRAIGGAVCTVTGSPMNFKITTQDDLELARRLLLKEKPMSAMRVGLGYDSHRIVEGRKLILAGLQIPYGDRGLLGHSDADVLTHALIDALLGAASLGNIGQHFPDTDPKYEGADSIKLLSEVSKLLRQKNYRVVNIDLVLIAQAPKMNPHVPQMIENLARTLGIAKTQINIKPKTNERMGFEGREEGMSAEAVVLLEKD